MLIEIRESMGTVRQQQDLLEDASRGFSEIDQLGSDTLIGCTHCTLTFTDTEKWLQHYRTIPITPRLVISRPLTGQTDQLSSDALISCIHCPLKFTDTERFILHRGHCRTGREARKQVMPLPRMALSSPLFQEYEGLWDFAISPPSSSDTPAAGPKNQDTEQMLVSEGDTTSRPISPFDVPENISTYFFRVRQLNRSSSQESQMSPPDHAKSSSTSHTHSSITKNSRKTSRRAAKRDKWESIREEVRQLYVVEGQTLEATMAQMQKKHSFTAR